MPSERECDAINRRLIDLENDVELGKESMIRLDNRVTNIDGILAKTKKDIDRLEIVKANRIDYRLICKKIEKLSKYMFFLIAVVVFLLVSIMGGISFEDIKAIIPIILKAVL